MKKILTSVFLLVSTLTFGQTWNDKIARKFYSRIDSGKTFDCCDDHNRAITLDHTFTTYEMPYNSVSQAFDEHYEFVMDSLTIETIVDDLVKSYNKIPKKLRDKFTRSCYSMETKTQVSENLNSDILFVDGQIHFNFSFQMKTPYKRNIFKRMIGIL